MSSSDRIILLTGGKNFDTDSSGLVKIPFRNSISITNKQSLTSGYNYINSDTFELASSQYKSYYELYADLNSSALQFKIPSKNMLIQVDQHYLDLNKKVFTSIDIEWLNALTTRYATPTTMSLVSQSEFIKYSESGIIKYWSCIPNKYYINSICRIAIYSGIEIPAGDLYLHFFQF